MQEEERYIRLPRTGAEPSETVPTVLPRPILLASSLGVSLILGFLAQWLLAQERDLEPGLAVWCASIAVFAIAIVLSRDTPTEGQRAEASSIPFGREMVLLAGVLILGTFFRLYQLDSIPAGLNHDAAWYGSYAIRINDGTDYTPFINCCGSFGRETMFPYLVAGLQHVLGPEKVVLNLAAALVGIATLAVFYFLVREMFGTRMALIATVLLSVMGWHWTFSRVGWRAVLVPLFEALVFLLLLLALRSTGRTRLALFAAAGLALGLSVDTYDAGKTIPLTAAAFLAYL